MEDATKTKTIYILNQDEIAEINKALKKANLKTKDHSRWFIAFVGEKLIEKFLGLEFCDTCFDIDIDALGFGVKTIRYISGYPNNIWISNFDLNNPQLLAYVSYNSAKKGWVLDKVKLITEFDFSGTSKYGKSIMEPKQTETIYDAYNYTPFGGQ